MIVIAHEMSHRQFKFEITISVFIHTDVIAEEMILSTSKTLFNCIYRHHDQSDRNWLFLKSKLEYYDDDDEAGEK